MIGDKTEKKGTYLGKTALIQQIFLVLTGFSFYFSEKMESNLKKVELFVFPKNCCFFFSFTFVNKPLLIIPVQFSFKKAFFSLKVKNNMIGLRKHAAKTDQ